MTLTEHLTERIQTVADKAGKPDREDEFTDAYAGLLQELTNALTLMKSLACAQVAWIQSKAAVNMARMN